jgi:hypothetical protein
MRKLLPNLPEKDKYGSHLPLPAPHTQLLFFCTAHKLDVRPAVYAVANGGLVEEKKRRIHLLAYSFNNIHHY